MRLSIRWLLLGVATASLLLPLVALFALRSFDAALVRQTERELNAQGALVAALYQAAWAELHDKVPGNPRDRWHLQNTYTPLSARIDDLTDLADPIPDPLPVRAEPLPEPHAAQFEALSGVLRNAQVFNLSGVRVLGLDACSVASSRTQSECYSALPEVKSALLGKASSALRARVSDQPPPAWGSLSRRGDVRVFVALPVFDDGAVIGAVLLSRTAESGVEWLFKQRRDVFYAAGVVLLLALGVSFFFSRLIIKPLSTMKARLESGDDSDLRLAQVPAPLEIQTLGAALDEKATQLLAKSRYIEQFAANVSHELKTPITSIRGAVELLQESGREMSEDQRQRFLANIDAAAERTDRLVNRLLQLARLEAGHEQQEESVSIGHFVKTLPSRYGDAVAVENRCPDELRYNASTLEAIIGNLLDNALRYRRSAPAKLALDVEGHQLHIRVEDDGPGISADNQKRLFERFFTTERDRGGTGLGLPIVLATAQSHGGRAEVGSSGEGTVVDVWVSV